MDSLSENGQIRALARTLRIRALRMAHKANASHIGSCLSMADLLAMLYGRILRIDPAQPDWPDRDRLILSKGHGAAIFYAALAECGFFPKEWLETYCLDGSRLIGHATSGSVPGGFHWFLGAWFADRLRHSPGR
jgi:transketolase